MPIKSLEESIPSMQRTKPAQAMVSRTGYRDSVFAFHDQEETGPRMLARISRHTGLRPEDV